MRTLALDEDFSQVHFLVFPQELRLASSTSSILWFYLMAALPKAAFFIARMNAANTTFLPKKGEDMASSLHRVRARL